jgi:hypothetical protein
VNTHDDAMYLAAQLDLLLPTKKAKKEAMSRILASGIEQLDGILLSAVLAVAARHPHAEQKFGGEVVGVCVRPAIYGTRAFHIMRGDGTSTDFSYIKAVDKPSYRRDVIDACRRGIQYQVDAFKAAQMQGDPVCAITGMPLAYDSAQVHHAPPMFDAMATEWIDANGGPEHLGERLDWRDNQYGAQLHPEDLPSWQQHHATHARLQLVHIYANAGVEAIRRRISAA